MMGLEDFMMMHDLYGTSIIFTVKVGVLLIDAQSLLNVSCPRLDLSDLLRDSSLTLSSLSSIDSYS